MRVLFIAGIAGLLLAAPQIAFAPRAVAFQQTTVTPTAPQQEVPVAPATPQQAPEFEYSDETDTEVSIPGLGKIGALPKLDFGLELLYGANEPSAADDVIVEDDGVAIQGRLKHKF